MRLTRPLILLTAATVMFTASGCQRTFIYDTSALPRLAEDTLHVPLDEEGARTRGYPVTRVRVAYADAAGELVEPSREEEIALRSGRGAPPGVEAVEVDVDTTERIWAGYTRTGGLIGVGLGVLMGFFLSSRPDAEGSPIRGGERVGLITGVGLGLGVYGLLIGWAWGGIAESGVSDLRAAPAEGVAPQWRW